MNEQHEQHEMQFADPAWQPQVTQGVKQEQDFPAPQPVWPASPDATAQPTGEAEQSYAQGYRAQPTQDPGQSDSWQAPPPPPFSQGQPQQQQFFQSQQPWYRRLPTWAWIVIGIIVLSSIAPGSAGPVSLMASLLIVGLVGTLAWLIYSRRMHLRVNLSGEAQTPETRTFEVGAHPTVVISNKAGSVNVRAGQEGQVSITATKRGYLFSPNDNDAQIFYNQDSTINRVTARVDTWRPFGKNNINFEVVVPPQTSLELVTNAGIISVQDVAGQMTLRSDAGTITATQVTLHGQSRLRTNAGSITFSGALDPAGDYELATDLGTVDVTLPADASFNLEARTDLGTVSTNLPIAQPQKSKAHGQVGIGPYPHLRVRTNLGTVNVQRR